MVFGLSMGVGSMGMALVGMVLVGSSVRIVGWCMVGSVGCVVT